MSDQSFSLPQLQPAWRWFGPSDPVTLPAIRQAGATGVVSALHDIPAGTAWTPQAVAVHKGRIEQAGLSWRVVESIPVTDAVKLGSAQAKPDTEAWLASLEAVAAAGVDTVCYNFMPVLDWTRTDLRWSYRNGALALRFSMVDLAAYDIHVLGRQDASVDYDANIRVAAKDRFDVLRDEDIDRLEHAILSGLPGADRGYTRDAFFERLAAYDGVDARRLQANLMRFLEAVAPVAEQLGVRLAIHPDDPPFALFGLPRVVSTPDDFRSLFEAVPSPANGLTFCTGSLGARADNDVVAMAAHFSNRIHFAHLRNVVRESDGSFHESEHLDGSVDMLAVLEILLDENAKRLAAGLPPIPFRPDHGHAIGNEADTEFNPGYTYCGRLRGLGELSGAMLGLARHRRPDPC